MNARGLGLGTALFFAVVLMIGALAYAAIVRHQLTECRMDNLRGDAENRILRREIARQTAARHVVNELVDNDIDDPGWAAIVNRVQAADGIEGDMR